MRPHAHALLAFDVEIARVHTTVSEPTLGEIRLQWWRDAIGDGAAGGHPVAEALLATCDRFNIDRSSLIAATEARAFDLYADPMLTEAALEAYVRHTFGPTFAAIASVLAPGRLPPPCVEAAAQAYGRLVLLCDLPRQVHRGQLFIPSDILSKFQLPAEHVLARRSSPAMRMVLETLRARIRTHLDAMRAGWSAGGSSVLACLPACLCEPTLRAMERPGFMAFGEKPPLSWLRRQWSLWRGARQLDKLSRLP